MKQRVTKNMLHVDNLCVLPEQELNNTVLGSLFDELFYFFES